MKESLYLRSIGMNTKEKAFELIETARAGGMREDDWPSILWRTIVKLDDLTETMALFGYGPNNIIDWGAVCVLLAEWER